MSRHPTAYALLALMTSFCACNSNKGPAIPLLLAGAASASAARCDNSDARNGVHLSAPVTKVRVTLRARGADGSSLDFCDSVLDLSGQPPFITLPNKDAVALDVFAEAYAPADPSDPASAGGLHKFATGALYGVSPKPQSLGTLRLYQTEQFHCAPIRLAQPRAFHTATLLPDGRVLFVGGMVASATDPTMIDFPAAGAPVVGTAEVYDPRDQSVATVSEPTPAGRAFHAAQLLSGGPCAAGQVGVLLVGGITSTMPGMPIYDTEKGMVGGRLVPFTPQMGTALYNALPTRAIGNEVLCLDPIALTATRMPVSGKASGLRATGAGPRGLVAAGGIDYDPDPTMLDEVVPVSEVASFDQAGLISAAATGIGRSGASLTVFADAKVGLVWGGGSTTDPIGELLSGLDATPASTPVVLSGTPVTQFHTATFVAVASNDPTILVTGGFEVTAGGSNIQPSAVSAAVRLLTVHAGVVTAQSLAPGGAYVDDPMCTTPATRYKPAGWESAAALSPTRVLVSGGTPSTAAAAGPPMRCADCATLLCPIAQTSIYDATAVTFSSAASLGVPRLGHTSTVLLDGSVLVSGGIGADPSMSGTTSVFLSDLEVYNPRTRLSPYDPTTGLDHDDPIYDELMTNALQRAPGSQAVAPATPTVPARPCSVL